MTVRVLIADDFELLREGIEAALESHPAIEVVGRAGNGLEAVERALVTRPDVLMLDLRMGVHGGMEALDALQTKLPGVRILILTANENPDNLRSALSAGAAGYLTKRATGEDLCEAVLTVANGGLVIAPSLVGALVEDPSGRTGPTPTRILALTARQRAVVRMLSSGLTDAEIATRLFVSARTVQYEVSQVKAKAGLVRRSEIARWAVINSLA